jgi:GT2 family glycosyltransferase
MTTSIVITTFNRNPQLHQTLASIRAQGFEGEVIVVDDGDMSHGYPSARFLSENFGARWIPCRRHPSASFRNPSLPNNIGIRAASGDILILQNAECKHVDPKTIEKLTAPVVADPSAVTFARVVAVQEDGSQGMLYCGEENPRPYFFCGAIRKEWLERLRGFDEDYTGAGYDDDDLADRLGASGANFVFTDVVVHHQWHPPAGTYDDADQMRALYQEKTAAMLRGELGLERNIGKMWGGLV